MPWRSQSGQVFHFPALGSHLQEPAVGVRHEPKNPTRWTQLTESVASADLASDLLGPATWFRFTSRRRCLEPNDAQHEQRQHILEKQWVHFLGNRLQLCRGPF